LKNASTIFSVVQRTAKRIELTQNCQSALGDEQTLGR